jgi:hypothetical protein
MSGPNPATSNFPRHPTPFFQARPSLQNGVLLMLNINAPNALVRFIPQLVDAEKDACIHSI